MGIQAHDPRRHNIHRRPYRDRIKANLLQVIEQALELSGRDGNFAHGLNRRILYINLTCDDIFIIIKETNMVFVKFEQVNTPCHPWVSGISPNNLQITWRWQPRTGATGAAVNCTLNAIDLAVASRLAAGTALHHYPTAPV